jgi:hypothetical protein
MRNKKTIAQHEARRRELLNRLVRTANELREIDTTITKIKRGQLRQPPPPGIKGDLKKTDPNALCADVFGDLIPSFGPR